MTDAAAAMGSCCSSLAKSEGCSCGISMSKHGMYDSTSIGILTPSGLIM